jgi:hypothetical protein
MRALFLVAAFLVAAATTCWPVSTIAQQPSGDSKESAADAVYNELAAGLPMNGQRANSARLELEYWHEHAWKFWETPVRKAVTTKDGKAAEVVFLIAPAMGMPDTDFSMAFLLVDKRVVDWASCWTYNRTARQKLMLEDVDGDGSADVAFRAREGLWGQSDKRQHRLQGDERKWLYAYAVTADGFQSLFPDTERDLKVNLSYDTADQPVALQVKGLPESLRERQMVECTLSAKNTSDTNVAIEPAEWFSMKIDKAGYFMSTRPPDKRTVLKPGETVSQLIRLYVVGVAEEEVTMRWKFVPSR